LDKVFRFIQQTLLIRTGTHARGTHAKGGINNQFLITGFSITTILKERA
jgi:hypothetical protein